MHARSKRWWLHGLQAVGAVWAAPLSLAGLLAGFAAWPLGARPRISDAALVFHHFPLGPGGAKKPPRFMV